MKRTVVRYRAQPDQAEANRGLIEQVFQELAATAPPGLRYLVLRLEDGSFLHIAETAEGAAGIPSLQAFRAFQAGIRERCVEPPVSASASIVGNYRMLAT